MDKEENILIIWLYKHVHKAKYFKCLEWDYKEREYGGNA